MWFFSLFSAVTFVFGVVSSNEPPCRASCTSCTAIRQTDLSTGTYRIKTPGCYYLAENIEFNPNPGIANEEGSYFPSEAQLTKPSGAYSDPQYLKGFFATITIEANNVKLNFNGKILKLSRRFWFMQRFHALIQVGGQLFDKGFGPFPHEESVETTGTEIYNGRCDLTSHHSIHGNGVTNLYIHDMTIRHFEVAGIHFNGFDNVRIENVDVGEINKFIPMLALYNEGRVMLPNLRVLVAERGGGTMQFADRPGKQFTVAQVAYRLEDALDAFFFWYFQDWKRLTEIPGCALPKILSFLLEPKTDKWRFGRKRLINYYDLVILQQYCPILHDAYKTFINTNSVQSPPSGTQYGMVFNSKGPAVDGFGISPGRSKNLNIKNVRIHDMVHEGKEAGVYFEEGHSDKKAPGREDTTDAIGPVGDVLEMFTVAQPKVDVSPFLSGRAYMDTLRYVGNPLSDCQVMLNIFGGDNVDIIGSTGFMTSAVKIWATIGDQPLPGRIQCNADIMFHTNKGTMGLRVDNTDGVVVENLKIWGIQQIGPLGSTRCGPYKGGGKKLPSGKVISDGAKTDSIPLWGYSGNDARGIVLINTKPATFKKVLVYDISSETGDALGVDIMKNVNVKFSQTLIAKIRSGTKLNSFVQKTLLKYPYPNPFPFSYKIYNRQLIKGQGRIFTPKISSSSQY